jgi:hypothetical protein
VCIFLILNIMTRFSSAEWAARRAWIYFGLFGARTCEMSRFVTFEKLLIASMLTSRRFLSELVLNEPETVPDSNCLRNLWLKVRLTEIWQEFSAINLGNVASLFPSLNFESLTSKSVESLETSAFHARFTRLPQAFIPLGFIKTARIVPTFRAILEHSWLHVSM